MLFDAGGWGMVEVDEIIDKGNRVLGIVNPDDIEHRITYCRRGNKGCSRSTSFSPEGRPPEARAIADEKIISTALSLLEHPTYQRASPTSRNKAP